VDLNVHPTHDSDRNEEDVFSVIWRFRNLILVTVGVVVLVALVATLVMPKKYRASVLMRVSTPGALSADSVRSDATTYLDRLENTYAKLGTSKTFRDSLAKQLRLKSRPQLEIRALPNSELMVLSATTGSPASASTAANGGATLLLNQVQQMNQDALARADAAFAAQTKELKQSIASARATRRSLTDPSAELERATLDTEIATGTSTLAQMTASFEQSRLGLIDRAEALAIVNNATKPSGASSPNVKLNLGVALVIGVLAAVALALILEYLRRRNAQLAARTGNSALVRSPVAVDPAALTTLTADWRNGNDHEPVISEPRLSEGRRP